MREGKNPMKRMFNDILLHNSINEILGSVLVKKLIKDTYKEIKAIKRGAKRNARKRST